MPDYANPHALAETGWVADRLNDPTVRLVEVDVDTTSYDQGHIPGAVGWNWHTQLQQGLVRDLVGKEDLERLLGASGIGNDTAIVLYGDNNNWFAAWAYWKLKYYRHADVRLLDGGRINWAAEGRPLTTDVAAVTATTYTASSDPDNSIRALRDEVVHGLNNAALVDVRSPREFSGELLAPENLPQEGSQRGGHIPGAKNIGWARAVREDATFKSVDELNGIYGPQGVTSDKEVIAYCRIGERAAHTWFVLSELLGYENVKNYDGSWTEWGSSVGLPIER
jgi:thiosulfate/3-mercaptopyruvate sulfurtransferase